MKYEVFDSADVSRGIFDAPSPELSTALRALYEEHGTSKDNCWSNPYGGRIFIIEKRTGWVVGSVKEISEPVSP